MPVVYSNHYGRLLPIAEDIYAHIIRPAPIMLEILPIILLIIILIKFF